MSIKKSHQETLIRIIQSYLPNCKIWLFGSRATGKQRAGSDIDLALDNGAKIPWETISKILIDIDETTIPMKVDVVDLHSVDDDFKEQVRILTLNNRNHELAKNSTILLKLYKIKDSKKNIRFK